MDERTIEGLLERGVSALEKLAEDPLLNMEAGPPFCPHCKAHDPEVGIREAEARGPLSQYVVYAKCGSCDEEFYAAPYVWQIYPNRPDVEKELEARQNARP